MRSIVFRFDDSQSFTIALEEGDQELLVPGGERVGDGEWVLAVFEIGPKPRATAAAARGLHREAGAAPVLAFERRDWEPLVAFAGASSARTAAASQSPSFAHWRATDPFAQGPHARVLLVDDDRDICEVVGAMLDAVGLTVEAAGSAEEALQRARSGVFDLLVLDWNLPGMTGVELCRTIRGDPSLAALPVLFLTAHASSRDVVEAFACGADDYVVKPFRAPELGARIFGLLRRARMAQPAR